MPAKPLHVYDFSRGVGDLVCRGATPRRITVAGRSGINLPSIHGRAMLPQHTARAPKGSIALWVTALDDLASFTQHPHHGLSNPHFAYCTILSDRENLSDYEGAAFAICYHTYWHPTLTAKFFLGHAYAGYKPGARKAIAAAGHFGFRRLTWYHLVLTWDHAAERYLMYANGVLVATHDHFGPGKTHDVCAPLLYIGGPEWVYSRAEFYDQELSAREARGLYEAQAVQRDKDLDHHLARMYEGAAPATLDFEPDATWTRELALTGRADADLGAFFVQGCGGAPQVTPDGLRIQTPNEDPKHDFGIQDHNHVYLWTHRFFEGDLHVRYDFRVNRPGGLSLLMTQCSGMQREDFLADYRLRTNGIMKPVCWEDIRNYHWEYYREMNDVRNDRATHAMLKNPWFKPMGFSVEPRGWEIGRWYRLDYVQQGRHIRGAIDGRVVIDALDSSTDGNGPVLNCGHVAIRCMTRTDITVRDLVISTRREFAVG